MTKDKTQPDHFAAVGNMVKQEPVAWLTRDSIDGYWYATNTRKSGSDDKPLYTSPPQRQPLTLQEIDALDFRAINAGPDSQYSVRFAQAIEAAHGIGDKT